MLRCKRTIGGSVVTTLVSMVFYYKDCSNRSLLCNSADGAFVPAVTVCVQGL